jgi:hypothetical protein
MTPSRNMARDAPAILAPLALAILCGCAHQHTPPAPSPPTAAAVPPSEAPATPAPARTAAASPTPAPSAPAPPSAAAPASTRAATGPPAHAAPPRPPATVGSAGAGTAASAAPAGSAAPPAGSAASPALNLASLEQRLRDTHAIGVFTKLSLKNQVDDLLAQFRDFYAGKGRLTLAELRRTYELLLMKVVTLLQGDDPGLASAVSSSREAIWGILSNRTSFNNL